MFKPSLYRVFIFVIFCSSFQSNLFAKENIPESISSEIDSLLLELNEVKQDTDKINILYDVANKIYSSDYERGIFYAKQSIELSESEKYQQGIAWGYYLLGKIYYYYQVGYNQVLESFFLSLSAAEYDPKNVLVGRLYNYISDTYSDLYEVEKQILYLEKSIEFNEKYGYKRQLSRPYNNLANCYFSDSDYVSALKYYRKSLKLDVELNDVNGYILTLINIGSCYTEMREKDSALVCLEEVALKIIDSKNLNLIMLYNNVLGYYYSVLDDNENAQIYFNKTIDLANGKGYESRVEYASKLLSSVYSELGMYKKAYESYLLYDEMRGENINNEAKKKIMQIEMKYKLDKKQKEMELEQKQKEIRYIALLFCLFILVLVLGFIFKRQKYKIRIQKAELKSSEFERKRLSDEVKFKNNELMNFALQIIQKNDFIREVKDKMKVLKTGLKKEEDIKMLNGVELFINQSMDIDKARKEFQMNIELLHQAFFYKLNQQFPNLTDNEKRLALLLRLNYSSKKIAALLNISSHGVDMGRYRLRRKLSILQETNLSEYLNSL